MSIKFAKWSSTAIINLTGRIFTCPAIYAHHIWAMYTSWWRCILRDRNLISNTRLTWPWRSLWFKFIVFARRADYIWRIFTVSSISLLANTGFIFFRMKNLSNVRTINGLYRTASVCVLYEAFTTFACFCSLINKLSITCAIYTSSVMKGEIRKAFTLRISGLSWYTNPNRIRTTLCASKLACSRWIRISSALNTWSSRLCVSCVSCLANTLYIASWATIGGSKGMWIWTLLACSLSISISVVISGT